MTTCGGQRLGHSSLSRQHYFCINTYVQGFWFDVLLLVIEQTIGIGTADVELAVKVPLRPDIVTMVGT